jgi:hypothetical protein
MAERYRPSVGIFEAATLLALAATALWFARPFAGARRAAAEDRAMGAILGVLADAQDAAVAGKKDAPYLPLDRLVASSPAAARALRGFQRSNVPGVWGDGRYWLAVLRAGRDGWLAKPGEEEEGEAARGYCIVAWPDRGAPKVLRAIATLPEKSAWQRGDGMEESGDPAAPPIPRVALPPLGTLPRCPSPPPDWSVARKRK